MFSLRTQVVLGTGLSAGVLALLFVLASSHLDATRSGEALQEHAETLAKTASIWLDGDAHVGLGNDPAKRLSDLTSSLDTLLRTSDYPGSMRTLRPKAVQKATLTAQPAVVHPEAMEVVIRTGTDHGKPEADYRPEMGKALFEGKSATVIANGRVEAYAPVLDSWGTPTAILVVQGPAQAPLWRRILFPSAAALFAGLFVSFLTWPMRVYARKRGEELGLLTSKTEDLARGDWSTPLELLRRAPTEFRALAGSLEALRARLEAQATGQPLPEVEPTQAQLEQDPHARLGEAVDFDLALLIQQLVEAGRKAAQTRKLHLQLVFPEGLPSQLVGYPMVLYQALDGLLRNAIRSTQQGKITLRVTRAGDGPQGGKLRFEVSDTGPGIAFKEQQELGAVLAQSALHDPAELKDPLQIASALAHALGGELTFETQPGQGSRFGFTVSFQTLGPRPATTFQPRAAVGVR